MEPSNILESESDDRHAKEFEIALEHPPHAGMAPCQDHFAFKSQAGPA